MGYFGIPFRNGVPIGLGSIAGFGAPQEFSPSELFPSGTANAWYDPSDLTTLFTTSAGTTPVAMPGLGSAVSVGLMLDKSQGAIPGSELVTNGNFSSGTTGWSITGAWAEVGGQFVKTGASTATASQSILTVGRWYTFSINVVAVSGTLRVYAGSGNARQITALGVQTFTLLCSGDANLYVQCIGADTATVDNISVRELPGNHAIAFNDTTARPELRARVNLLVATATLSTQSVTTQATSYTLSFAGTGSITLSGTATGSYSAGTHTITCTAGTLTLTVSGTVTTADLRPANSGALLPAYQAVVDANTYDTSGFPLYLRFDGVDDSMYTPASVNLSGTDKATVFAGVRKLSDAAGILVEGGNAAAVGGFGIAAPSAAGNYAFALSGSGTTLRYRTATTYTAPISNVLAMSVNGSGATYDDKLQARINAIAVTLGSATDPGAGNLGTYPLFIGSRNNSSVWFNGHLYSLVVVGSAVSAGNISATEQWVANKTGIVIP